MTCLFLVFVAFQPRESLLRVHYDIEVEHGDRRLTADLALNMLDERQFSISCRKTPGGVLFTCWATPDQTYLLFPKADLAFLGDAQSSLGLFPGGPELPRAVWLRLLLEPEPHPPKGVRLARDGSWSVLTGEDGEFTVRWRLTRRLYKNRYSSGVLEPRIKEGIETVPLSRFSEYWDDHDLD